MFTSCGWFHDEISGIETAQCLQYAARAIHLAKQFDRDFEDEFHGRPRARLRAIVPQVPRRARSLGATGPAGRGRPRARAGPPRDQPDLSATPAMRAAQRVYLVRPRDARKGSADPGQRAPGRRPAAGSVAPDLERRPRRGSWSSTSADSTSTPCSARRRRGRDRVLRVVQAAVAGDLPDRFARRRHQPGRREFPGRSHRLDDLFRDEQRRIIGIVLEDRFADYQRSFELLANQDEEVLNRLGQLSYPIPKPLRAAASTYLDIHLRHEIGRLVRGEVASLDAIDRLCERGRAWGYQPERELLEKTLTESLLKTLDELRPDADLSAAHSRAHLLLAAATRLGIEPDLWQVQNRFLTAFGLLADPETGDSPLREEFDRLAARLKVSQSLLGWRP